MQLVSIRLNFAVIALYGKLLVCVNFDVLCRSVFDGNYQMGRPHTGAQRSLAVSMMTCSSSFTAAVVLLLSAFAVVLCRDIVSGTQ